jgi:hypothetical protein
VVEALKGVDGSVAQPEMTESNASLSSSKSLSSLSSSFVGMTSIFFTISRITDREGKRVQRVGMRQASHRLKRIVAPARANANDKI